MNSFKKIKEADSCRPCLIQKFKKKFIRKLQGGDHHSRAIELNTLKNLVC